MTVTIRSIASLALFAVLPLAVHAQTAAPVVPVTPVAPADCPNPGPSPLDKQGPTMGRFTKRVDDYKTCINAYVNLNGGKANELGEQSKVYRDAANKAIADYNAYITTLNESNTAK